ncbi:MAG: polyprenol monophosphomannose synthase, partial [Planctomyces sp.]|nr:polyprenol monophosphomannose synthase [Planctomyces sp.]
MTLVHEARVLISICTYNERENIRLLLPAIRQELPQATIMVVDDSSPDGTADVVNEFSRHDDKITLMLRRSKEGLGAAQLAAFRQACASES